jgi:tight adherence protein B
LIGVSVRIGGRADQILQRMGDFMRDLEQAQQELARPRRKRAGLGAGAAAASAVLMAFQPGLLPAGAATRSAQDPADRAGLELLGAFLLYRLARSL